MRIKIILGIIIVIVAAVYVTSRGRENADTVRNADSREKTYTLSFIASRNNESSCWTAISGSVYDLTAWIEQHPGGAENILSICGKDGTAAFTGQHDGQERPETTLSQFRIGLLTN